jgi:hypothetical protein
MLMWAFVVLRKGLPRMSDTFDSGCMSNSTKSTSMKDSPIFTSISSTIPIG